MNLELLLRKLKENPLALLLCVASLGLLGYVFAQRDRFVQAEKTIIEMEAARDVMRTNKIEAKGLKEDMDTLDAYIQDIESRLMIRADNALNVRYFYTLQEETGVKIQSLDQLPPKEQESGLFSMSFYSVIDFEISLSGTVQSITSFLHLLRSGRYFTHVTHLRLTGSSGIDTSSLNLNATLSVLGRKDVL